MNKPRDARSDVAARLDAECLESVPEDEPSWLWKPHILYGEASMLVAKRKTGKGHLTNDVAARVSRGWPMPPYDPMDPTAPEGDTPGKAILIKPEDNTAYTLKPQMIAAGADLSNIFVLSQVRRAGISGSANTVRSRFSLPQDVPVLRKHIDQLGDVRQVVIDPLMACATRTIAFNLQARMYMIEPLQQLAMDTGVAIWLTHHFNKFTTLDKLEDKINGSGGLLDALRITDVIISDPLDPQVRVTLSLLNNLSDGASEPVEFIIDGKEPYTHVLYRTPPPMVTSENLERIQTYLVAMISEANRPVSGQELASYFRLDYSVVRRILVVSEKQGLIQRRRGAYIIAPELEAKQRELRSIATDPDSLSDAATYAEEEPGDADKTEPVALAETKDA